jgi:hypothetical protein
MGYTLLLPNLVLVAERKKPRLLKNTFSVEKVQPQYLVVSFSPKNGAQIADKVFDLSQDIRGSRFL